MFPCCRQPFLQQQHQQQALMIPQQDTYLNSRAEALHNVESTITELGGIFQQLAHMASPLLMQTFPTSSKVYERFKISFNGRSLREDCTPRIRIGLHFKRTADRLQMHVQVQEQGEMAIRIDENVDDTLANVDSAQAQLLKYLNSISSNRWLIMKVFFVLMMFMMIFVVFIA